MEDITIKSVTHCPTCGSECKVEGSVTHHYIPIKKYTEEDLRKAFKYGIEMEAGIESFDYENYPDGFSQFINSLNKQD